MFTHSRKQHNISILWFSQMYLVRFSLSGNSGWIVILENPCELKKVSTWEKTLQQRCNKSFGSPPVCGSRCIRPGSDMWYGQSTPCHWGWASTREPDHHLFIKRGWQNLPHVRPKSQGTFEEWTALEESRLHFQGWSGAEWGKKPWCEMSVRRVAEFSHYLTRGTQVQMRARMYTIDIIGSM